MIQERYKKMMERETLRDVAKASILERMEQTEARRPVRWPALAAACLLALSACTGLCASLYVDNREEDLTDPERVNLRAEPSTASAIVPLLRRSGTGI